MEGERSDVRDACDMAGDMVCGCALRVRSVARLRQEVYRSVRVVAGQQTTYLDRKASSTTLFLAAGSSSHFLRCLVLPLPRESSTALSSSSPSASLASLSGVSLLPISDPIPETDPAYLLIACCAACTSPCWLREREKDRLKLEG